MSDDVVPNRHDAYVKWIFSDPARARQFFEAYLPSDVVSKLNFASLTLCKESYVDAELRQSYSDLVYRVAWKEHDELIVYLLFEHKSHPDPLTPFQLLRYMVRIWEQRVREGLPLCCVVPVVFYHGVRPWKSGRTLAELVAAPESMRAYVPEFQLELCDLGEYSDAELRREALLRAPLLLLKYVVRREFPARLPEIAELFQERLKEPNGLEDLCAALRYISASTDQVSKDELTRLVETKFPAQGKTLMPTIAEQWVQEGREEGREEGLKKGELIGQIRTLQKLLDRPVMSAAELSKLELSELQPLAQRLNEEIFKAK